MYRKGMYDSVEYAMTRINHTVVMHKRKPILVQSITNGRVIQGKRLDKSGRKVSCNLDDVTLLDLPLGFLNKDGKVYHLSRKAMRHDWRQGLRPQTILVEPWMDVDYADIGRCLLQRYPTFSKAVALVGNGHEACAWTPDLAINNRGKVWWKSYLVGSIEGDEIHLRAKFKFLSKMLKESTNECYAIVPCK
jgi:hypothetical protein